MEKRYSTDWAKAKSRDLVKDMIERTLLKFVKPQDMRVLCFPGIDAEEIFRVYDPLGIPRSNIVGVERDAEIADAIESKHLGIKLEKTTLKDYILSKGSFNFDVVSLDYTGPLNEENLYLITRLSKSQVKNHFVLHTANLLKRDAGSIHLYYHGYVLNNDKYNVGETYSDERIDEIIGRSNNFIKKLKENKSIYDEKKYGYTSMLRVTFAGTSREALNTVIRFISKDRYKEMLRHCEQKVHEITNLEIKLDEDDPFGSTRKTGVSPLAQHFLEQSMYRRIEEECRKQGITNKLIPYTLNYALIEFSNRQHRFLKPKDAICYSYISESGAPMVGDIYFLSYPYREIDIAGEVARSVGFPDKFEIKNKVLLDKLMRDYIKAINKFMSQDELSKVEHKEKNRIFLGNSSKPVLTKGRAIEEFKVGTTIESLKEKYRGWTNKPLPQWKAHVTMHTYDTKQVLDEKEDSDLEKITKEEVLDLLSSDIPADEIYDAFPTSFSIGQLRAYKAHLTMGSYNHKG